MNIGYACLTLGVPEADMKSCLMKNAGNDRLKELILSNLKSLDHILDYNRNHNIKLFRISSDLIPFGSSPVNFLPWWDIFAPQFFQLGEKIRKNGIRVSMHPGQYTVLNSPEEDVVRRAVKDLEYHAKVLDCLGTGRESKIILHIGGVYQDKKKAIERFINHYKHLKDSVKERLVIENDDRLYHIGEVLDIGKKLKIPVVFDNLHHEVNPSDQTLSEQFWIRECRDTWKDCDGPQKIHYSQQEPDKKEGSHSKSIRISEFLDFCTKLYDIDPDIMLEVKDKNLSAVKCINCIFGNQNRSALEQEWSKYQFSVLEKSSKEYNEIKNQLKMIKDYPVLDFYQRLEYVLQLPESSDSSVAAAFLVWEYLKDMAANQEKENFKKNIINYQDNRISLSHLKAFLRRLAVKYRQQYLLDSYYFIL